MIFIPRIFHLVLENPWPTRTHNVALSDYRRLNKKGGYAPPNAAGGTWDTKGGRITWTGRSREHKLQLKPKTNGPTTEGFEQIASTYLCGFSTLGLMA